jgi:hypothetical protein
MNKPGYEDVQMQRVGPVKRPDLTFPKQVIKYVADAYGQANSIFEYGSGGSTVLASEMGGKTIYSVESDSNWADSLKDYLKLSSTTLSMPQIVHIDIGPTTVWGHPKDTAHWMKFKNYPLAPWVQTAGFAHPDIVLIDGRFRVACFLISVFMCQQRMKILFDDYIGRDKYARVEKVLKPSTFIGRMAVFDIIPTDIKRENISLLADAFFDKS